MAICIGVDLDHNYPCVEIVDSLVDEATTVARMSNNTASALILDDSKLVHKFVKAAHVCNISRHIDRLEWENIEERVLSYLRSIRPRFELYHVDDWAIDTLYHK